MCGIVGARVFQHSSFTVTQEYLARMRDTMSHRGPDGIGLWISADKRTGLGHRRLSIIDLSECANQPMCNEDQSVWVSFNGEVYNHADIRAELNRLGGHQWKTDHSDTEVIVHAFEQWGIGCLEKFRGMFAIAIWDERRQELWLIRDRVGIKPLYYSIHHGRIVFASEIKALLADPQQERRLNEEAFYHYLSFLVTPAPDTLFDGIKKIPNGTWIKISADGQMQEKKYWDVLDHTALLNGESETEIAKRIIDELRISVKLRKVSDVPVGVFLSGGIDSSTNTYLFSEGESRPVKTFSIGYTGKYTTYQNELDYANKVAKAVNSDHHELLLNMNDLVSFLPKMVFLQDEPIADPVCVPVYYVSKLARDNGVIVCQVGEGADELFCGYPQWMNSLNLQRLNSLPVPRFAKKLLLKTMSLFKFDDMFIYEYLRRATRDEPIFWGGAEAFTDKQKKNLLSKRLRSKFSRLTSWEVIKPLREKFLKKSKDPSPLNWMTYLDLNLRLPELLLMRVDKMSMGVSLEARVPFLDHKFVELAMSIPSKIKTKNNELKYILKKAVTGLIPDEIIHRKKQGFGVPIYEWYFQELGDVIDKEFESFFNTTDILDPDGVKKLMRQKRGPQLWYLFNFIMWWKEFMK